MTRTKKLEQKEKLDARFGPDSLEVAYVIPEGEYKGYTLNRILDLATLVKEGHAMRHCWRPSYYNTDGGGYGANYHDGDRHHYNGPNGRISGYCAKFYPEFFNPERPLENPYEITPGDPFQFEDRKNGIMIEWDMIREDEDDIDWQQPVRDVFYTMKDPDGLSKRSFFCRTLPDGTYDGADGIVGRHDHRIDYYRGDPIYTWSQEQMKIRAERIFVVTTSGLSHFIHPQDESKTLCGREIKGIWGRNKGNWDMKKRSCVTCHKKAMAGALRQKKELVKA